MLQGLTDSLTLIISVSWDKCMLKAELYSASLGSAGLTKPFTDVRAHILKSLAPLTHKRPRCAPGLDLHSAMSVGINAKKVGKYFRGYFSF